MKIEDIAYNAQPKEVLEIQKELIALYYRELFEKEIYLEQMRKLEGDIVEILKRIELQEEKHAELLMILLSKANVEVPKYIPKVPLSKINAPIAVAVEYDVEQEEISSEKYLEIIEKASPNLKQFLKYILYEEYAHIKILQEYLGESVMKK
ncbi:MAG: ferritin-like domain-containing protein [archaeon]